MRDINRIDRIVEELRQAWHKCPDWRMGQIFENLKRYCGLSDMFYMEDNIFEENLKKFFNLEEELKNGK